MSADHSTTPLSERGTVVTVLIGVAIALAVLGGLRSLVGDGGSPLEGDLAEQIPPEVFVGEVAQAWIDAWVVRDVAAMRELAVPPAAELEARVASFVDGLRITALRASPRAPVVEGNDRASVVLDVAADLQGLGTWTFVTTVPLTLAPDAADASDWRVSWSRAVLHPALTGDRRLAVTRAFAPRAALLAADGSPLGGALVGRVGVADADGEERLAGDPIGTSGLQAAFDRELGGSASGEVQVVDASGVVAVLARIHGRPPAPVQTSIDPRIQGIVDAQLAGVDQPAGMVVVRPSTGEVVASASNPAGGFNRALNGRYPPGSTFKVVTSTALLTDGLTPDSPASCPEIATINGREFRNAEGAALGDIPFRRAFYESCNTAFVQLAAELEPAELLAAAERFGFNAPPGVELPSETSSFPEPHSVVDQASAAIGQGRVLASPLQMATVAATVAAGEHRPTTLRQVVTAPPGTPLPDGVAATLQELMRLVVAEGTGTAARLPGAPVAGKTGTAEFGTDRPPRTHAWFIGFRGDLALAVVVEDSGFGGVVAAPLAREVFRQIG